MPELPEVETVKVALKPQLAGKSIKDVIVHHENMIKTHTPAEFQDLLKGQIITDIERRGKWLIFILTDYQLLSHLRMEGKFFYGNLQGARDKHVHVEFILEDGTKLLYEDVRKFGTFHLYPKSITSAEIPSFAALGPEPWEAEFNVENVSNALVPLKCS